MLDQVQRIERFENALAARMGQLTITDQHAQTAGGKIAPRGCRDPIERHGEAQRIIGALPSAPAQQQSEGRGAVDVRELLRFFAAIVDAQASKRADIRADLLFEIERHTGP
jgi:hypothetical protein